MSTELPKITIDQVMAWVDDASFERGQAYYQQGRISAPQIQGTTLVAECAGSEPTPYRVEVTLGESGIVSGDCSCPIGAGGYCKHAVALLLTWYHEPEAFVETEPVAARLERLEHTELVALAREMIRRYPDLESLLTHRMLEKLPATQRLNAEQIRKEVSHALHSHGHEWTSGYHIANDLGGTVSLGLAFANREDWANAVVVYRTVLDAVLDGYDQIYDDEGTVLGVVSGCADHLSACLANTQDAALREITLRTLFRVYRWDIDHGGYGVSDGSSAALVKVTSAEERQQLATWVREGLPSQGAGDSFTDNWHRQVYGGFLLRLGADHLDDEAYLQICRETGRNEDYVERLLELQRIDEAFTAARQADDYTLPRLADRFEAHEHGTLAQSLIQERTAQSKDARLLVWLKSYAERYGDLDTALEITKRQFWTQPSMTTYCEVRRLAGLVGNWPALREEILDRLPKEGYDILLLEIHLEAGEGEAALAAYTTIEEKRATLSRPSFWGWHGYESLRIRVAEAIETAHPWVAVRLYTIVVEDLIAVRGRESYATAAKHLLRVRAICAAHNDMPQWEALIQRLRDGNRRLRALKEELHRAGL